VCDVLVWHEIRARSGVGSLCVALGMRWGRGVADVNCGSGRECANSKKAYVCSGLVCAGSLSCEGAMLDNRPRRFGWG
jgi:hypothetical protein